MLGNKIGMAPSWSDFPSWVSRVMNRQEFDKPSRRIMFKRATDENGIVRCECCKAAIKGRKYAFDHIIADAHKSDEHKATRKLTAEDGQLLCSGFEGSCHDVKTRKDTTEAAKLVRAGDKAAGIRTAPAKKIQSGPMPTSERAAKRKANPKPPVPNNSQLAQWWRAGQ